MKQINVLFLAVALVFAAPVAVVVTGCTTSQQATTYKTLASIGHSTDAAMKAYMDLVVAGKVPSSGLPKVANAYGTFQAAFNAALVTAQGNPNATAPIALVSQSADVLAEIEKAKVQH